MTQTPQQPQWEARYSPDMGWYTRLGEDVESTWYPEHANKAHELAAYLNAQQQRIQSAEKAVEMHSALLTDALDDVLQWRTIADEATAKVTHLEGALRGKHHRFCMMTSNRTLYCHPDCQYHDV